MSCDEGSAPADLDNRPATPLTRPAVIDGTAGHIASRSPPWLDRVSSAGYGADSDKDVIGFQPRMSPRTCLPADQTVRAAATVEC